MPDLPPFVIEHPFGCVEVILQVYQEGDERVCGLRRMEGKINLPPKALRAVAKHEITKIEQIARKAGCTEMRHVGPGWRRILDDYEKIPGVEHGLRKRL